MPATEGELALGLAVMARERGRAGLIHIAVSEGRAERLAHLLWRLAPEIDTFLFPPWDCLPYDRASPSARAMGLRVATLSELSRPRRRSWLCLATPDALQQRIPPRTIWAGTTLTVEVGGRLDPEALGASLQAFGYRHDERVDEPGEYAARGAVIDVFPAGYYLPVRISHQGGVVAAIASFDGVSQRTTDGFERLVLRPVSEAIVPGDDGEPAAERPPGLEHRLPELYPALECLLDYVPEAAISIDGRAEERGAAFAAQVRDAYESRLTFDRGETRPLPPERLYLDEAELTAHLAEREVVRFEEPDEESTPAVPVFALAARPGEALAAFVRDQRQRHRRVVLAGPSEADLDGVATRLERTLGERCRAAADWAAVLASPRGALLRMPLPVQEGFVTPEVALVAVADVLGSQAEAGDAGPARARAALLPDGEEPFRIGEAVIHLEHGVGILRGLETVDAGQAGTTDTVRLEYAGGAKLMAPIAEVGWIWRYGGAEGVSPDRLDGDSWPKRRAKVEVEIGEAAAELARIAAERRRSEAPKLVPPRRPYERFVARFPFAETPDQRVAVAEVLRDLRSGRRMERLVCGDVGFGKTEAALRAAAAAALAGRQVAVVAPTTVLARQHLQVFTKRFAGLGIAVGHLSRLVRPAEARAVKAGLKDGGIRIAIGTQALAGKGVAFQDLGLLIVDEEQRFGAADKAKLKTLGEGVHVLTLTATPIPRTLQAALAGLQEVSLLATPPAERQPIRTFVQPLDEATLRDALLRERRRGGQSFVVCPRIEDIAPMEARLRRLLPELDLRVAHGKLPADEIDATMVAFGAGEGDVLLATNIIESGLDVPRANTMVVWRADRFGLAQLHQLRGRVGRGRARGIAYLWTDPDTEVSAATAKRLETLAAHDRLGAGFEISAEDLDQRGAGDLIGDRQAGHVKLIGSGLYRRLLERALLALRGEATDDEWTPELNIGLSGRIPEDYVPEAEVRLNLYAKVARSRDRRRERQLADEIEDRFGPPPAPVSSLLLLARLQRLCRAAGIARVDAGPQGIALTFKNGPPDEERMRVLSADHPDWARRGERLVLARETGEPDRAEVIETILTALTLEGGTG